MSNTITIPTSIEWHCDHLQILNQQKLPKVTEYLQLRKIDDFYDAILSLKVRGAPAIGITAAYGLALSAQHYPVDKWEDFLHQFKIDKEILASSRPTAVNLFWALERLEKKIDQCISINEAKTLLLHEAIQIHAEDEETCRQIGEYSLEILTPGTSVLTICNAGSIATAKYGTALAPFHLAREKELYFKVFACETRPVLQGSRLTTWELQQSGVDVTLITDSMAAHTISNKGISAIIVGADRIASNGDTANKIGTLSLAIIADHYGIPFYVAAPSTTFDLTIGSGSEIPIEERPIEEVTSIEGVNIAPEDTEVFNPAFDVTPSSLITAIITEKGIIHPDFNQNIKKMLR
ncbi:S-methyl-5-thioribose-1-phosphate isomerase [Rossellomorea sp. BNER]|uniref:S-methyl-5-thioribose-1-phosphate isomerase n=1 Tax=Rossellomorea sp. BNER TaxID=2962031 RepID=UPI003AF20B34|nr:S-methyl-5-thioribose-1-phosphate isomerase [Rossellomorea sp. BNER]